MSFLASGSRSIGRNIPSCRLSTCRHVSSSTSVLNSKVSRPSGSAPAPYTAEDNQGILAMNDILRKSLLERSTSSGARDGAPSSTRATPIQTFRPNQLYDPIDLHKSKLFPAARRGPKPPLLGPPAPIAKRSDPFFILDVNPIDEATNHRLVSAYITQMGKIKTRAETGLTWKSQRRVGKMVRRARAIGLISRWDNNLSRGSL